MITLTGRLICATPEQSSLLRNALPDHVALTRAEPGCLRFEVIQTGDPMVWPQVWQVDETFADAAAFQAHQARTRASHWWQLTADILREFQVTGH